MLSYNAPIEGRRSTIEGTNEKGQMSDQMQSFKWLRKSLIESRKDQYFMPLASVTAMPKHMGKTVKVYEYIPLLDDRNINDQGIDASGATMDPDNYLVTFPKTTFEVVNANTIAVVAAINANIDDAGSARTIAVAGTPGATTTPVTLSQSKAVYATSTTADAVLALGIGATASVQSGNLYGSSRDIGTIVGRMPLLDEFGGRKNRVGFTRIQREGEIHKFGIFYEFTQESLDFDSDEELRDHLSRELMNGAVQLTEAVLQKDLLAEAGTVVYAGAAINDDTVTGNDTVVGGAVTVPKSEVSYSNLQRLDQILTDKRTPRQTKVITGSRLIDTRTIGAGRIMYVGSALMNTIRNMRDNFNEKAFIPVQHYADAGTILNGEEGSIGPFRIIQVPEMLHWAGAGADEGANADGYRTTNGKFDIYPMFVVGSEAFTTIGFQTDGKTLKFDVKTVMPKDNHSTSDPYGETGFSSIKWYYGTLILRPERLAMIKTVAKM